MNTYPPQDHEPVETITPDEVRMVTDPGITGAPPPHQVRVSFPAHTPVLTWVLLGINVVVFVLDVSSGLQLTAWGARANDALAVGQVWRLVTAMFLHGSITHLGFNMLFLSIIGRQLEAPLGALRFAMVYFVAGIAGSLMGYAFSNYPSIGASGALFGLMSVMLLFVYRNRQMLSNSKQALNSTLRLIGINIALGLLIPNIDNWGHVGGLIGGLAMGWFTVPVYEIKQDYQMMPSIVDGSNPTLLWLAFGGSMVVLSAVYVVITLLR